MIHLTSSAASGSSHPAETLASGNPQLDPGMDSRQMVAATALRLYSLYGEATAQVSLDRNREASGSTIVGEINLRESRRESQEEIAEALAWMDGALVSLLGRWQQVEGALEDPQAEGAAALRRELVNILDQAIQQADRVSRSLERLQVVEQAMRAAQAAEISALPVEGAADGDQPELDEGELAGPDDNQFIEFWEGVERGLGDLVHESAGALDAAGALDEHGEPNAPAVPETPRAPSPSPSAPAISSAAIPPVMAAAVPARRGVISRILGFLLTLLRGLRAWVSAVGVWVRTLGRQRAS